MMTTIATQTTSILDLPEAQFVLGPQVPISTSWFDTTEVDRARVHGEACPVTPPADPDASVITDGNQTTSFNLLHYYDLALTEYTAYQRTGDPVFLGYARKAADAWWQHPWWIQSGAQRDFDNGKGPPPRHAGIGGLILRALDGRPEMWDWITAYSRNQFNVWLGLRVNDTELYYGVREGAFMLQYADWLAAAHPDPAVRAEFLSKAETIAVNYFGRLQYPDGSWRWNDYDIIDADGGYLQGITQPFMVGLLLNALIDVHQLTGNDTVKASVKKQITSSCLSLFTGPYRINEPTGLSGVNWRSFWYFYYGGTSVNPTKYATGGNSYTAKDIPVEGTWVIANERQSISTIFDAYAYAYLLDNTAQSNGLTFKQMGEELFDSAFVGTDGFRGMADDTAKNYNQNYRRGGTYLARLASTVSPTPTPSPTPSPTPTPTPVPPEMRTVAWPKQQSKQNVILAAQWGERFKLNQLNGSSALFEKVP